MKKLLETIYRKSLKAFDFQTMEDLLYMSKEAMKTDIPLGVEYLRKLSVLCEKTMQNRSLSGEQVIQVYDLHKRVCFAAAKYDFDSYLLYVEWNRDPEKKFYPPRRKVLKQVVDAKYKEFLEEGAIIVPPNDNRGTIDVDLVAKELNQTQTQALKDDLYTAILTVCGIEAAVLKLKLTQKEEASV